MAESLWVEQVEALSLPLVNRFYKQCRYSAKAGRGETVFALRRKGVIVAALRLVDKPEGFRFLRSMCVEPGLRGQGLGLRLLQGVMPTLDRGPCYCFPFAHLESFYARVGIAKRDPEELPTFIRDAYQRYRQQGRNILVMVRSSPRLTHQSSQFDPVWCRDLA